MLTFDFDLERVERAIRYLKDNFIKGRIFADLEDLKAQGGHWQNEIANRRVHATTEKRPVDLLALENLTPCSSIRAYRFSAVSERIADAEGFVRLSGSRYSVPPAVAGKRVIVEQGEQQIRVRVGQLIVAEHRRPIRTSETIANPDHVAQMWQLAMARRASRSAKRRCFFSRRSSSDRSRFMRRRIWSSPYDWRNRVLGNCAAKWVS